MKPSPPTAAMPMAMRASVTVSMAADTMGMLSWMFRVRRVVVSTDFGSTSDSAGRSRTSSNVSARRRSSRLRMRTYKRPHPRPSSRPAWFATSGAGDHRAGETCPAAPHRLPARPVARLLPLRPRRRRGRAGPAPLQPAQEYPEEHHPHPEEDVVAEAGGQARGLLDVRAEVEPEADPERRRDQGGGAVEEEELPVREPGVAGREVGGGPPGISPSRRPGSPPAPPPPW